MGFIFDNLGLIVSADNMNPTCVILDRIAVMKIAANSGARVS
jgi:hypothetical protein